MDSYNTKIIKINRTDFDGSELDEAARLLRNGELVAFPTETVYGLGGNALDPEASKKIYSAKGRPSDNPLIVHIAEKADIYKIGREVPESVQTLMDMFWPGPLTIIVKKSDIIPKETTGGLDTVAVRLPSDEIAGELIRRSGVYVAAPSANASGRPSTTRAEHCFEDLAGRIPLIIDGGPVKIGLESTIIDMSSDKPLILRPGYITIDEIRRAVPDCEFDPVVIATAKPESMVAKAPGMKYRHYAPKGELIIFRGEPDRVISRINEEIAVKKNGGKRVAVLATEESRDFYQADFIKSLGRRTDEEEIARHLFEVLRSFDELGAEYIFGECFFSPGIGQAIMNRLVKACGYNIIDV